MSNTEGFLSKMSITKVIAHQDKLASISYAYAKKGILQLVQIAYAERMENCAHQSVMGAEEETHFVLVQK